MIMDWFTSPLFLLGAVLAVLLGVAIVVAFAVSEARSRAGERERVEAIRQARKMVRVPR